MKRLPAPPASPSAQGKPGRRFGFNIGFYIALSILLLVTGMGWGQGQGWHYLSGNLLRAVKFVGQEGWVIGSLGHIIHSTDGGETWEIQVSGTPQDLLSLTFINSQTGWIGGMFGTILKTTDGGRNWIPQIAPTGRNISKIIYLDDRHGWFTSGIDSIFRTTDGGATWEVHASGLGIGGWVGIAFVDSLLGWVAGGGVIIKSTDGGVSWVMMPTIPDPSTNICMVDSGCGWVVGYPARAYHTTNGWRTWAVQPISLGGFLNDVSFQDTLIGYLCGGANNVPATVYWTTNGGTTWLWDSTLIRGDNQLYGIDGGFLPNWAIAVGKGGPVVKTTNGGVTWRVIRNVDIDATSLLNVSFIDSNRGWAVGTYGVITHTINGGTVWRRQPSGISSFLYGVSFTDSQYGKICTDGGGVLGTRNGGNTWAGESTGATSPLWSIDYPDTSFAVAVGGYYGPEPTKTGSEGSRVRGFEGKGEILRYAQNDTFQNDSLPLKETSLDICKRRGRQGGTNPTTAYRTITRTTNGGTTWLAQNTTANPLYGVKFITRNLGWACGDGGIILHTTDLGATWQTQTTGVTNGLYWITFHDTLHGWACGSGGRVLWTTDGGNAWNIGTSGVTQYLNSIAFTDTLTGFAVSDNGLIIRSTDGGRNWVPDTSKVHANLTAVCALDSTHVWTVGSYGMVLGWGKAGETGTEQGSTGAGGQGRKDISLGQSYPNPTRGIASFEYELDKAGKVRVKVYNVTGQAVRTLVEGMEPAGRHVVVWDGKDASGRKAGSGTYFYQLDAGGRKTTRKMVIIK